jgi:hypothetical protein
MRFSKTLGVCVATLAIAGGLAGTAAAGCLGNPLTASLTGAAETPAGDPAGAGKVTITFDPQDGLVCWSLTVHGTAKTPVAAHIHKGAAGTAGPVVVPIGTPANGATKGCTAASRALIKDIIANPASYYVNVHTGDFPAGAVRGQLAKA